MKALSIQQPWAWLIIRPDLPDPKDRAIAWDNKEIKDIENRNRKTNFRGRFLIHASQKFDHEGLEYIQKYYKLCLGMTISDFDFGCIIGALSYLIALSIRIQNFSSENMDIFLTIRNRFFQFRVKEN